MKSIFLISIRLLTLFFFGLLLCFPSETLSGASTGLLLWFQTVLPTLLPSMILADFLLRIRADHYLTHLFARPISRLFGLSHAGSYAVLVGFLCGYPMGAKTTASLLNDRHISPGEASYLLAFTNQPSPMFLIGYLCLDLLADQPTGPMGAYLAVTTGVYGSAMFISLIYRLLCRMRRHLGISDDTGSEYLPVSHQVPDLSQQNKSAESSPLSLLEASMMSSFEVMVKIGGYMMLFSIAEVFVWKLSFFPTAARCTLMGFVEMTTGSRHIAENIIPPWSIALCTATAAFGGMSGFAQTTGVLQGSGLSTSRYFLWKLLQGILAGSLVLLGCFFLGHYPAM